MPSTIGHTAVQVDGSNNSVTVTRGEARLTLLQRHKRRREPRERLDLLDPYAQAIELVGRDDDLGALEAWLAGSRPIGVRCLTGRAGSGKTRLALELCERAESNGWLAGFVAHEELVGVPAAAASGGLALAAADAGRRGLCRRFRPRAPAMAGAAGGASGDGERKLRLLLLERHANAEAGWWAELTRFGGFGGAGLEDLLDPPVPVALPSLRTVANSAGTCSGRP